MLSGVWPTWVIETLHEAPARVTVTSIAYNLGACVRAWRGEGGLWLVLHAPHGTGTDTVAHTTRYAACTGAMVGGAYPMLASKLADSKGERASEGTNKTCMHACNHVI